MIATNLFQENKTLLSPIFAICDNDSNVVNLKNLTFDKAKFNNKKITNMASFIVYVRNNKIDSLNRWLSNPDYKNIPFSKEDLKIYLEDKDSDFVTTMLNHKEFTLINDFLDSYNITDIKSVIDRKIILREYLKRIGAEPSKIYSIGSTAIDEVLQIGIDIIEETYSIKEKG